MTVQQDVAPPAPALGWRELAFVGLLLVELLAAMQVFLTATLLPSVAADLGGRAWYAAAIAASAAIVFVTMPVAGPLADRLGPARVLALFAPAYVAGGVVSAAAPAMWVYVLGRAVLAVRRRLLMPGALRLRAGRPAAIGALLVLAAAYFGVDAVVVIVCRERLGASGLAAGLVLSAGALAWSLATVARERLPRRLRPPPGARGAPRP